MLSNEQKQILKLEQQIAELQARKERYEYYGILSEYQTQPELIAQRLDYTKLNPTQHFLFKRVLHGLNVYTPEQRSKLHWDKKRRIKKVWQRGQREVNAWKQVITAKKAMQIFSIFNTTELGRQINSIPVDEIDPTYINKISFKDLGLTYEDLILFYMKKGLLPKNFLTIK
jgi:hypothetical protein